MVVAAQTGARLLEMLGSVPPDVVVSDYRLAGSENGFDVITQVRAALGAALPAIVVTGDTHPELMRAMAERGICVAHKPLDAAALQDAIARLVSVRPIASDTGQGNAP